MHDPLYTTVDILKQTPGIAEMSQLCFTTDANGKPDPTSKVLDESKLAGVINRACDKIDSAIGGTYSVPLSTVPGIIEDIARAFTLYDLYIQTAGVPKAAQKHYEESWKLLREIASGEMPLAGISKSSSTFHPVQPFETDERGAYTEPLQTMAAMTRTRDR